VKEQRRYEERRGSRKEKEMIMRRGEKSEERANGRE